jgi:dTDP-4-amino-4,6-dideoxygalactose transaminase
VLCSADVGSRAFTTGGGGAILTNDDAIARRAKHLTTTAKLPHRWEYEHDEVGFNYRMPNLNAALGCAQLEEMATFLSLKRLLHARYQEAFSGIAGLTVVGEPAHSQSNYWLQALLLDPPAAEQRDSILAATNDAGFMTRPVWRLIHQLKPYRNCPRAPLPVTESLEQRLINIPSSADIA